MKKILEKTRFIITVIPKNKAVKVNIRLILAEFRWRIKKKKYVVKDTK